MSEFQLRLTQINNQLEVSKRFGLSFLALQIAILLFVGCGNPFESEDKQYREYKTIMVHGDPLNLVKGSRLKSYSPINTSNYKSLNNFNLARWDRYTDSTVEIKDGTDRILSARGQELDFLQNQNQNIESGNETTFDPKINELSSFNFKRLGDYYLYYSQELNIGLLFEDINGSLELKEIQNLPHLKVGIQVLHYSIKSDGTAFSILGRFEDEFGEVLLNMVFTKNLNSTGIVSSSLSRAYTYIMGEGVGAKWKEPIELNLCGPEFATNSTKAQLIIDGSIAWGSIPGLNQHGFKVFKRSFYPPFSDLNTNCLYLIQDYVIKEQTVGGRLQGTLGVTMPTTNVTDSRIVASSVFIADKTIAKLTKGNPSAYGSRLKSTTSHEIGHFLGLGHEFRKGPSGKPLYKSIMSYDPNQNTISNHDKKAIEALYKK